MPPKFRPYGRTEIHTLLLDGTAAVTWTLVIRPHRLDTAHKMWPLATDVARGIICVTGTQVSCAKTGELIEIPVGG